MPYEWHAHLQTPDDGAVLWRYLDGAKLAQFLLSKELFFPSGQTLRKCDNFEGSLTHEEIEKLNVNIHDLAPDQRRGLHDPDFTNSMLEVCRAEVRRDSPHLMETCFLSCWHANDSESDAMWKIYSSRSGCAIVSSIAKFKAAVTHEPRSVYLGEVAYCDLRKGPTHNDIFVRPFFRKRLPFRHEKELRALVYEPREAGAVGLGIRCDPFNLVAKIVISPYAEPWFLAHVKRLTNVLGYGFSILPSPMGEATPLSKLKGGGA